MVKKITTLGNLDIVHVFDFEESQNEAAFKNTLNAMKSAAKIKKKVKYSLGYSNNTFDLWIILHKLHMTEKWCAYCAPSVFMEYIKLDRDKSTFKSHRDFSSEKEITFKHL